MSPTIVRKTNKTALYDAKVAFYEANDVLQKRDVLREANEGVYIVNQQTVSMLWNKRIDSSISGLNRIVNAQVFFQK